MFKSKRRRKNQRSHHSATVNSGNSGNTGSPDSAPTFIGPGVFIEGILQSQAPLRIDGRVKGEIDAKEEVTIGKSGIVEGPIKASHVIIAGEVVGDITVAQYLHVLPSGRLEGSTHTPRLIVEEGALFKGKSEMTDNSTAQPPPKTQTPGSTETGTDRTAANNGTGGDKVKTSKDLR